MRLLAPKRGEAWVKFRNEMYERQQRRALVAVTEARAVTGLHPDEILDRIRNDEGLADLFATTIETAMRTRWAAKLRALGRVLARGLDSDSDTAVDATEVIGRIVGELDPPHVRALATIAEAGPFNPGQHPDSDALSDWLRSVFPSIGPVGNQVGAVLIRNGLVTDPFYVNGVLRITELGLLVLGLITQEGGDDLPGG